MNRWQKFAIAFSALLLAPLFCWGDTISGRVVGVTDGDTVTVLVNGHDQYKIRLSGIDAPEKKQAFGTPKIHLDTGNIIP